MDEFFLYKLKNVECGLYSTLGMKYIRTDDVIENYGAKRQYLQ
jgi:hypothetical protein